MQFDVCERKNLFGHPCLSAPAWGYIDVKKHIKTSKKSEFKDIFFKLATNGQSDKEFLLTSKFYPQGVVCPCPVCLKSYFKEIVLKLATNGQSDKGFLLKSTFIP